ncbi:5'-methylthioadenosine/S-adenosylhomocysteine nucleosidase family protein [Couchioplanes caeruleus]|uniref:Purine phosphorylase n=2 Tax=Couchioplanes caeruleus TaxID=56438 RepID=A0A1K0GC00_9ACTN|nr:5'-methylthioadenosine/S-adenosylhomocysteine nucleosidase [Couchioplanes caeruleus]OJF14762.1 purine phosphorylase [Couchioplanes caeruleus subsp. caeruleus]ROP28087.1 nucleoside phosphorylase [Couchioplanes caeruleus]
MSDLVVILTAMNLEYEAVRDRMTSPRTHRHPAGTLFEVGRLGTGGFRVALGLVGKGNHPAAVLAERAMAEFSPAAVLFVGVAGALWPSVELGDVVVASQVYAYHGGTSEDDGLRSRPRGWETSHAAAQVAQRVIRTGSWAGGLPGGVRPRVHFGPIAAGEIVQDSAVSAQAGWIRQHYNDALAVEMEAAGVAQAGHLNGALPVVVVRGISDRADGEKAARDGENWQPRAVVHAAAFAAALAAELVADGGPGRPAASGEGGPAATSTTHTNVAGGNARVGNQGTNYGDITFERGVLPPTDVAAGLADLRGLLERAHHAGELDPETCAAAKAEIDAASRCLAQGGSGLVVALKRLRGLVTDVADLAARATGMIAVAKSLS